MEPYDDPKVGDQPAHVRLAHEHLKRKALEQALAGAGFTVRYFRASRFGGCVAELARKGLGQ